MARLRLNNVSVLTFEERTRVSNFFMLLVEIDFRLPKTTKTKTRKRTVRKAKPKHKPTSPRLRRPGPIKKDPCTIKCPAMCCSSRTARRDLFLNAFTRIFMYNQHNSIMRYDNDRHHHFIAYT